MEKFWVVISQGETGDEETYRDVHDDPEKAFEQVKRITDRDDVFLESVHYVNLKEKMVSEYELAVSVAHKNKVSIELVLKEETRDNE